MDELVHRCFGNTMANHDIECLSQNTHWGFILAMEVQLRFRVADRIHMQRSAHDRIQQRQVGRIPFEVDRHSSFRSRLVLDVTFHAHPDVAADFDSCQPNTQTRRYLRGASDSPCGSFVKHRRRA